MQEPASHTDLLHRPRLRSTGPGEATPYRLKQMVAASVGNFWTLQHAQLYTEPERLAKAGLADRAARARRPPAQAVLDHRRGPAGARASGAPSRPTRSSSCARPRCSSSSSAPTRPSWRRSSSRRTGASSPSTRPIRDAMDRVRPATDRGWRSTPASPRSASRSTGGRRLWSRQMATAAEPRPAELPLPGGRPEARVRLHPLLTGEMIGPEPWFLREEGRLAWRRAFGLGVKREEWLDVPVPAFLVEHPRRRADPDRHRLPSVGRGQAAGEPRPALGGSPSRTCG